MNAEIKVDGRVVFSANIWHLVSMAVLNGDIRLNREEFLKSELRVEGKFINKPMDMIIFGGN